MLLTLAPGAKTLRPAPPGESAPWIHVVAPDDAERKILEAAGLPATLVEHALDVHEPARMDRDGDFELVVLRVLATPPRGGTTPPRTVALGVLLTRERVFTITSGPTEVGELVARAHGDAEVTPAGVLLAVLAASAEQFLAVVREVDRVVDTLEEQLATSQRNREVLLLLDQQKTLVRLGTALRANRLVADRLGTDSHIALDEPARERLADVLIELHQAMEMVTVSTDILSQMMDAFASIISNNLNVVMKMLTALTLVMTGPMLVASLWGMNVAVPGQHHPWAFVGLLGGSVVLALGVARWFRVRGWL